MDNRRTDEQETCIRYKLAFNTVIFSDVPGRTHLVQHMLRTNTDKPIKQHATYGTLHALEDKLCDETLRTQ